MENPRDRTIPETVQFDRATTRSGLERMASQMDE
jgi:hypothetical protein